MICFLPYRGLSPGRIQPWQKRRNHASRPESQKYREGFAPGQQRVPSANRHQKVRRVQNLFSCRF